MYRYYVNMTVIITITKTSEASHHRYICYFKKNTLIYKGDNR